ncbi:hypothetical protein [Trichocoleus sp. DQ-U1]|uniref:hypothetical protein n=1 Tax=Trichocoleus sp. DQ-U1 TaxID=2933926 RepID=UPI003296C38C
MLATPQSAAVIVGCDRLPPILDTEIATTVRRQTVLDSWQGQDRLGNCNRH